MTINVIYLAYFNEELGYNINTIEKFINSYEKYSAGIEHSLTIIAKNCKNKMTYGNLCDLAEDVDAKIVELPDDGLDFGSYFRIAEMLDSEYVLFCGTKASILCNNWLLKLYKAFKDDDSVQLVGPMGSWGDSKLIKFPNPHIRTSVFMIKRDLFLEFTGTQKYPEKKEDTYNIEHGEKSLTNFILNKGYKAVVVNRDDEIFAPEDWDKSDTYRSPGKSKSIFADRHTRFYDSADQESREIMEKCAWGRAL